jgi:dTDP-D-glucose 4,6-dehydratase
LKTNHNKKKKQKEKNHVGKHFSNPQYFVRKTTVLSSHNLAFLIKSYQKKQKEKKKNLV